MCFISHLSDNTHVRIKIYLEFYHSIVYLANDGVFLTSI